METLGALLSKLKNYTGEAELRNTYDTFKILRYKKHNIVFEKNMLQKLL